MGTGEIISFSVFFILLGIFIWWTLFRRGADYLDGTWLGMFLMGSHPKSRPPWNADSYRLWAIALLVAMAAGGIIMLVVKLTD